MRDCKKLTDAMETWKAQASELFSALDKAIDGGQQIKLIAIKLQQTYETGIAEGISMEQGLKKLKEGDQ